MTGYPDDSVRARAMKAGAVCFLNKPFDEDPLYRMYRESFEGCLTPKLGPTRR
jgi:FixJ family two-component response regulator